MPDRGLDFQPPPSTAIRRIETGGDAVSVRPQAPGDAAFLASLFRANTLRILEATGLPLSVLDDLVAMQHRSRMHTYTTLFPSALWSIVERRGEAVGEIIEHDEGDCVYVVDIALMPALQARGLGTALMRMVMEAAAARGQAVRAKVMVNNEPSLKMFRKLGFVPSAPDEVSYMDWRWAPAPGTAGP